MPYLKFLQLKKKSVQHIHSSCFYFWPNKTQYLGYLVEWASNFDNLGLGRDFSFGAPEPSDLLKLRRDLSRHAKSKNPRCEYECMIFRWRENFDLITEMFTTN
jgi:hypothetical protein